MPEKAGKLPRSHSASQQPASSAGPKLQTETSFPSYAPKYVINPLASCMTYLRRRSRNKLCLTAIPAFRLPGSRTGIFSLLFPCYTALLFVHLRLDSWLGLSFEWISYLSSTESLTRFSSQ